MVLRRFLQRVFPGWPIFPKEIGHLFVVWEKIGGIAWKSVVWVFRGMGSVGSRGMGSVGSRGKAVLKLWFDCIRALTFSIKKTERGKENTVPNDGFAVI